MSLLGKKKELGVNPTIEQPDVPQELSTTKQTDGKALVGLEAALLIDAAINRYRTHEVGPTSEFIDVLLDLRKIVTRG